jgi:hypothetical protein
MLMPGPQEAFALLANNPNQPVQLASIKPVILRDGNVWFEPDLGFIPTTADVNMRRLARASFVGEERKAEAFESEDGRQNGFSPIRGSTAPRHRLADVAP